MERPTPQRVQSPRGTFAAIDFETADRGADSACAVGLVRVEDWRVVRREYRLLRPPRRHMQFSFLHGITWEHVRDQPTFAELWPELKAFLDGVQCLAAHNAGFDRSVLHACCRAAGFAPPEIEFKCTMRIARKVWGIYPTRLPNVCAHLRLPLRHHDAASDAEACALIMIEAYRSLTA